MFFSFSFSFLPVLGYSLLQTGSLLPPGVLVMLINVHGLPGVADPLVLDGAGGQVAVVVEHVVGKGALLRLVLVLQGKPSALKLGSTTERPT